MRQESAFNNGHNNYSTDKYYFQKDKKPINVNEVDTKNIVLSNKTSYGREGANKCYIGYVGSTGFRPLHIEIRKKIKLYTNHMNVLADNKELLKYIKIWDKIVDLFNKKHNKKVLYNNTIYNKCIKTKISLYNEKFHGNKKLTKDKYYGNSMLLIESTCEVKNKYYPQTLLDEFSETHNDNNINSLFKVLVQIIDWSDRESNG